MTDRRRVLSLMPGLHRVADGRWGTGGFVLVAWAMGLWTLVARWDRVAAIPYGGLDEWIALVALLVTVGGGWAWSLRDAAGGKEPVTESQWHLASRAFRRNGLAVTGLDGHRAVLSGCRAHAIPCTGRPGVPG